MKRMTRTLMASILSLLAAAGWCGEDPVKPAQTPRAGLKMHVDPVTGERLEHPNETMPPLELEVPHATSSRGLREVESPEPGGGVSVDLEGRFQVPLEATVGPQSGPAIRHREAPPAARPTAP
ncbi:MAG: hypothetical protein ACT4QB_21830 [Gammaproteobacteria bacterium]